MNQAQDNTLTKETIRTVLAQYIAGREHPSDGILHDFLETDSPFLEQKLAVDRIIIEYLEANSSLFFSKGMRFVLPISSKFGKEGIGEPLIHPDGSHMKGVSFQGIKFHNGKDNVDQGAKGDGKSVIIIGG